MKPNIRPDRGRSSRLPRDEPGMTKMERRWFGRPDRPQSLDGYKDPRFRYPTRTFTAPVSKHSNSLTCDSLSTPSTTISRMAPSPAALSKGAGSCKITNPGPDCATARDRPSLKHKLICTHAEWTGS